MIYGGEKPDKKGDPMRKYKDVKRRLLAAALAVILAASTLTIGVNTFADFVADAEKQIASGDSLAQVFTASADYEQLQKVEFQLYVPESQNLSYGVSVYQNLSDTSNPTSGVLRYSSGTQTVLGQSGSEVRTLGATIPDSDPIYLSNGETYSVVVTFSSTSNITYYHDTSATAYWKPSSGGWSGLDHGVIQTTTGMVATVNDITDLTVSPTNICMDSSDTEAPTITTSLTPAYKRSVTYTSDIPSLFQVANEAGNGMNGVVNKVSGQSGSGTVSVSAAGTTQTKTVNVHILTSSFTDGLDTFAYTGTAIEPAVKVSCGGVELTKGTDYTVSYTNSTNVGSASAVITGIGTYAGYSHTLTYSITPQAITQEMVNAATFVINTSAGTVTNATMGTLLYGTDFTATAVRTGTDLLTNSLTYDVTVTGVGNYTTSTPITRTGYKVTASTDNKVDINDVVTAELDETSFTYDSEAKTPSITYEDASGNDVTTAFASNCIVSYTDNINAGTAKVTIEGDPQKGYSGTITKEFTINTCNLTKSKDLSITIGDGSTTSFMYTGNPLEPAVTARLKTASNSYYSLVQGTDYKVTYENNVDIGTMTIKITGIGTNFRGTVTKTCQIIGDLERDATVEIGGYKTTSGASYASRYSSTYNGKAKEPTVDIMMGEEYLEEGVDYTLSYENNVNASTTDNKAKVLITGIGTYAGKQITATFTINPATLSGTLKITDTERVYNGKPITLQPGEYSLTKMSTTYTPDVDYVLSYTNNTDAGTATVTATGQGNYTGTVDAQFTISALSVDDSRITVSAIGDQTYTGNQIKPEVKLYYQNVDATQTELPSSAYTVSYSDNINMGTATVTIKGKGNLTGQRTVNFQIVAKSMQGLTYTLGGSAVTYDAVTGTYKSEYTTVYTGLEQKPTVVIKDGNTTLSAFSNYSVAYKNNVNASTETKQASVIVTGAGNYEGSMITITFTIAPRDINEAEVAVRLTSNTYKEGDYTLPELKITDSAMIGSKQNLVKDTAYTVTGTEGCKTSGENKEAIITGIGNYTGTKTVTYTIGEDLTDGGSVKLQNPYTDEVYTPGAESGYYYVTYLGTGVRPKSVLTHGGTTLTAGNDYDITYTSDGGSGASGVIETVTVTYTGKNDYYGTLTKQYVLLRAALDASGKFTVINNDSAHSDFNYEYDGSSINASLTVKYHVSDDPSDDITLRAGTDYQLSSSVVGPDAGDYAVEITGLGNYQGKLTQTYHIEQAKLADCTVSEIADQTYTGKDIRPGTNDFVVTNAAGTVLTPGIDYDISGYANNRQIGDRGDANAPTVTITGKGNYKGSVALKFSIVAKDISDKTTITISTIDDQIYTGQAITPSFTVMYGDSPLTPGTDYEVLYTNNTNPGKATITLTGKNTYAGTATTNFNIIGDISDINLFQVENVDRSYELNADGTLNFTEATVTVKYVNDQGKPTWLDEENYTITQFNCSAPGDGRLIVEGKNFCRGSRTIPIKVVGNLTNATITNVEDTYYTGSRITPHPIVRYGTDVLAENVDYTIIYGANTNAGIDGGTVTIKAVDGSNYKGSKDVKFDILYDLSSAVVTGVNSRYDYNGSAHKPTVTVSCSGKELSTSEYSVTYGENTEAGVGTVTISPKASYVANSKTVSFEIVGISMLTTTVTLDGTDSGLSKAFTADSITPVVQVTYGGKTLTETKDYSVRYSNNTNVGEASVIVSGMGSYYGSVTKTFTITAKDIAGSDVVATVSDMGYAGGHPVVPQMSLTYNGHTLEAGRDYNYTITNNEYVSTELSTAQVTFTGIGNYTGTKMVPFKVTQTNLAGGTVKLEQASAVYSGSEITPAVTVTCPVGDGTTYTLQEGVDYDITYSGTVKDAGKYSISVNGRGNFYGSLYTNFVVEQKGIDAADIAITVPDMDYTGSAVEPTVTVEDQTRSVTLQEGVDYEVTYHNNTASASKDDENNPPTVTLTGKGNYGSTKDVTFNIGKSLADAEVRIPQNQQEFIYDGQEHIPSYAVYLNGTLLREGTDYEMVPIDDAVSAGTKTLAVKGINNYFGKPSANYVIHQKVATASEIRVVLTLDQDENGNYYCTYTGNPVEPALKVYDDSISTTVEVDPSNYTVSYVNNQSVGSLTNPAYVVVSLKGNYAAGSETMSVPFVINHRDISDFKLILDQKRMEYTGNAVLPAASVVYDNGVDPVITLVEGVDYDLTVTDNINAGQASVVATAKGNYTGEVSATFDIVASLTQATVTIEPQFYTGNPVYPPVEVVCGGNVLEADVDYKVDYYSDDGYTTGGYVIITPLSSYYSDSARQSYTISFDLDLLRVTGYANQYTYTGKPIKPEFVIVDPSGNEIAYDKTQIVYARTTENGPVSVDDAVEDACINVGSITAYIPATAGDQEILMTATYEIIPKNINACEIIKLNNNTYNGKAIETPVTLLYDGRELNEGTEYTVMYSDNVNPGVASATVQGVGNFIGTSVEHFNIVSPAMVGVSASPATESSIRLTWLRNGKATGYEVFSADHKIKYGTTTTTSFIANGLKPSTNYVFHVRSYVTINGTTTYGEMKEVSAYTKVSSTNQLTVTSTTKNTATLNWDRSATVGGYEIYRSTSADSGFTKIAVVPNGNGTYTDKRIRSGRTYYYKVRAYKPMNGSYVYGDYSKVIAITVK